jgi:hypothetical protein
MQCVVNNTELSSLEGTRLEFNPSKAVIKLATGRVRPNWRTRDSCAPGFLCRGDWGAHAPRHRELRLPPNECFKTNVLSEKVRCGEGVTTSTRGRVRSPEDRRDRQIFPPIALIKLLLPPRWEDRSTSRSPRRPSKKEEEASPNKL